MLFHFICAFPPLCGAGNNGPDRTPLEWPARLSIAQGVAMGLTYLHRERDPNKIPHGNIKSSNVLMGKNFEVCISDFGLAPLMPSHIAAQRMAGYRAPEYSYYKKITHKADVYSFGVLLMELLTGMLDQDILHTTPQCYDLHAFSPFESGPSQSPIR